MNRTFSIILVLILGFTNACETIVEVDLPEHEPTIVANAIFNPDSVWSARLFKSKGILESGHIETIQNATVQIKSGDDLITTLLHVFDGYYRVPFIVKPEIGRTYTLVVSAPEFTGIEATDIIPNPVPLTEVKGTINQGEWDITARFTDPVGKNYYQIVLFEERDIAPGRTAFYFTFFESDDLLFFSRGGVNSDDAIFDDALIAEKDYSLKLKAFTFSNTRAVYVVLMSISESYFRYMKSFRSQQDNDESPFSSPVQVYSNIENGIGIFAGFSSSTMRVRL